MRVLYRDRIVTRGIVSMINFVINKINKISNHSSANYKNALCFVHVVESRNHEARRIRSIKS